MKIFSCNVIYINLKCMHAKQKIYFTRIPTGRKGIYFNAKEWLLMEKTEEWRNKGMYE